VPGAFVNVVLARWHGPSARLQWLTCGDRGPLLVTAAGTIETLDGAVHDALGVRSADRAFALCGRRLEPGERLVLLSDGVLGRQRADGSTIGVDGVREAVAAAGPGAAATVRAIEDVILRASADLLEDDATVVVFAVSDGY
jgi:serine phosphatase RsbU (regulator of sigma subunit)